LKTFGSCLVLATLAAVLALLPLRMVDALTGRMLTWVETLQENTLLAPSLIVYSVIESLELLPVVLNLGPELSETEAYLLTPEAWI
jgi:hypothetical protein